MNHQSSGSYWKLLTITAQGLGTLNVSLAMSALKHVLEDMGAWTKAPKRFVVSVVYKGHCKHQEKIAIIYGKKCCFWAYHTPKQTGNHGYQRPVYIHRQSKSGRLIRLPTYFSNLRGIGRLQYHVEESRVWARVDHSILITSPMLITSVF